MKATKTFYKIVYLQAQVLLQQSDHVISVGVSRCHGDQVLGRWQDHHSIRGTWMTDTCDFTSSLQSDGTDRNHDSRDVYLEFLTCRDSDSWTQLSSCSPQNHRCRPPPINCCEWAPHLSITHQHSSTVHKRISQTSGLFITLLIVWGSLQV